MMNHELCMFISQRCSRRKLTPSLNVDNRCAGRHTENQPRPRCAVVVKPKPGQRGILDMEDVDNRRTSSARCAGYSTLGVLGNYPAGLRIVAFPHLKGRETYEIMVICNTGPTTA